MITKWKMHSFESNKIWFWVITSFNIHLKAKFCCELNPIWMIWSPNTHLTPQEHFWVLMNLISIDWNKITKFKGKRVHLKLRIIWLSHLNIQMHSLRVWWYILNAKELEAWAYFIMNDLVFGSLKWRWFWLPWTFGSL